VRPLCAIPLAGCAHQAGICRFGRDPKTSVLDVNGKAHELKNLYVVGRLERQFVDHRFSRSAALRNRSAADCAL
jgi:GMC oxidoreductase